MNVLSWLRLAIVNWHQLVLFLVGTSGHLGAFLIAQLIKNPPAMRETWVRCLGWEDPLEKGKASHSSILAWRIPWTVQFMQLQRVKTQLSDFHFPFPWKKSEFHSLHFWTLKVRVRRKMKVKDALLFHQFLPILKMTVSRSSMKPSDARVWGDLAYISIHPFIYPSNQSSIYLTTTHWTSLCKAVSWGLINESVMSTFSWSHQSKNKGNHDAVW